MPIEVKFSDGTLGTAFPTKCSIGTINENLHFSADCDTITPKEVIARELLKCRKSTLLEWKNLPVLNAVTEDMGYTSYGDYRAYIAKHPSDQSENKAASKLLGKKVYGPCLIQFVSKEGKFQYMRKKLCPTFYKYLQRRLGCYMTFFHKYISL